MSKPLVTDAKPIANPTSSTPLAKIPFYKQDVNLAYVIIVVVVTVVSENPKVFHYKFVVFDKAPVLFRVV